AGWQDGETRDLHAEMMELALAIVARTLMDVDTTETGREVGRALDCVMADFSYRFESLLPVPVWLPTPWNLRLWRAIRQLDRIVHHIIQQRRASPEDRGDLLSKLIHATDEDDATGMTDRQLRDELMTMLLAGHETTANGLAWTWYLLAQYPDV